MKTIEFTLEPLCRGLLQNSSQNPIMEQEKEYIEKQEILDAIRAGLLEMKERRESGKEGITLQQLIDEL